MKTLLLGNQKGGVGKSFVNCQLSYFLANAGLRVLNLELDHQKNTSRSIMRSGWATLAAYPASAVLASVVQPLPDGAFVAVEGDDGLTALERTPDQHNAYVNALRRFLDAAASHFDVCIIDTNPNPDIRYVAAMVTADFLLSPIELNQEAIDGIASMLHHPRFGYYKIKRVMNPSLELIGILPNMVEATPFQRSNLTQLVTQFSSLLIRLEGETVKFASIPTRTAIAEAQAAGVPLWLLRQAVPADQLGKIAPGQMPIRTAARDAWREVKPAFVAIASRMGLQVQ
jgi:chromosome partitioning protein